MGEFIDISEQTSFLPYFFLLCSLVVGTVALFGYDTENDDDDSDSGSGGLMQPI